MYSPVTERGGKFCLNLAQFGVKSALKRTIGLMLMTALSLALLLTAAQSAEAQTESVLHSFGSGSDGAYPISGLVFDKKGNLYGTTWSGGLGNGTVFELTSSGTEKVLYSFGSQSGDGANPYAGLIFDKKGNLYGTTYSGGASGCGTVFKMTSAGTEAVLYSFTCGTDGATPIGGLVSDKLGNLYGTTQSGGASSRGTVFKVTPAGAETVLYSFTGTGSDGRAPQDGLVLDKKGNLYGTTLYGGNSGNGTVFKVTPTGTETVLYSFAGGADGADPIGGLALDKKGNLYGTTSTGGANSTGTVFKVTPAGKESVLYTFGATSGDGASPFGSLVFDKLGNLYGTTQYGGPGNEGTVFKLSPTGTETLLHTFTGNPDGYGPRYGSLVWDKLGNLYGATAFGGTNSVGTVFKLVP